MAKRNYKKSNQRKENKNREEEVLHVDTWHTITVAGCIILFFCFFYFITLYATRESRQNNNGDTNTTDTSTSDESEILLGRSFSMSDGEYLVIYYDATDDEIASTYSDIVSAYSGGLTIYVVDMGYILNKGFVSETSNMAPTEAGELAINGPTLIKFNNHQVVDYIEGEESIRNYLG